MQRWYSSLNRGRDPYILYSASNAGSLLALLAYPVAIEPVWTLGSQSGGWRWGFALYGLAVLACGFVLWRQAGRDGATVGKTLHRIAEKTLRDEIEGAGFKFVADADFLRHPEDTRTNIVFKNPTPNDEFLLKFRRP